MGYQLLWLCGAGASLLLASRRVPYGQMALAAKVCGPVSTYTARTAKAARPLVGIDAS